MGLRRLFSLTSNLSPQSATARLRVGGADWGTTQELLASLLEMMDVNNRLTFSAASGKKAPWQALKIDRPKGKKEPERRKPSPTSDLLALFDGGGAGGVKVD